MQFISLTLLQLPGPRKEHFLRAVDKVLDHEIYTIL